MTSPGLAALMDAADCIVTKPGGSTTAEIAYRGVPAVYDAVDGLFEWEKFGVDVLVKRGHGVKLRSADDEEVAKAVAAAIRLGRNSDLSRDASGRLLNTAENVRVVVYLTQGRWSGFDWLLKFWKVRSWLYRSRFLQAKGHFALF